MSKARLVITAIEVEGRTPAEVCAAYGVSRSWVYELLARFRAEGDTAFEPHSRRLHTSPRATPPQTVELVLQIRKQLTEAGLDAGADTLGWHLTHQHRITLSRATVRRRPADNVRQGGGPRSARRVPGSGSRAPGWWPGHARCGRR